MKELIINLVTVFCTVSLVLFIMLIGAMAGESSIAKEFNKCLLVTDNHEQCYNIVVVTEKENK